MKNLFPQAHPTAPPSAAQLPTNLSSQFPEWIFIPCSPVPRNSSSPLLQNSLPPARRFSLSLHPGPRQPQAAWQGVIRTAVHSTARCSTRLLRIRDVGSALRNRMPHSARKSATGCSENGVPHLLIRPLHLPLVLGQHIQVTRSQHKGVLRRKTRLRNARRR